LDNIGRIVLTYVALMASRDDGPERSEHQRADDIRSESNKDMPR